MATEAQKRANEKYRSEQVKQVNLKFYPNEMDLYEFLKEQGNVSFYLKDLIARDMYKKHPKPLDNQEYSFYEDDLPF